MSELLPLPSGNVAHLIAAQSAEIERLREALKEIRSRSSIDFAMHPNPFALTAALGDIYQIAGAALEQEDTQ